MVEIERNVWFGVLILKIQFSSPGLLGVRLSCMSFYVLSLTLCISVFKVLWRVRSHGAFRRSVHTCFGGFPVVI